MRFMAGAVAKPGVAPEWRGQIDGTRLIPRILAQKVEKAAVSPAILRFVPPLESLLRLSFLTFHTRLAPNSTLFDNSPPTHHLYTFLHFIVPNSIVLSN